MTRYYLPVEDRARKVILPFLPAGSTALEDLLSSAQLMVPQRGTAARLMDLADQNARHLMESLRLESFETEERAEDPVYALGRDLGLTVVPRSLVCIDISTNQGRDTVGSLVWFEAGRPRKAEYRKFKIKAAAQQDDYAAIHEVVTRYLTRRRDEAKVMPDLMIIDGGKGQLNAAWRALRELDLAALPLASLAKRQEEVFLPGRSDPLVLSRRSSSLRLLQRARDEAHRFGLAYSRKRRSARTITSELLELPGIGPTKRQRLLQHFGSLAGVKSATAAEIAELHGFSNRSAQRLLDQLLG
jgi:excinuclease ABC subunit C